MGLRGPKPREGIVWSPEIAYGVGLMASDGYLSQDGYHLTMVSKDREQIEHIKICFNVSAAIKPYTGGRNNPEIYYRVQWGDVTLYNFLLSIGLTPHKSLTIGALKIPDEYFFDFLRGSFDGDGCFYSYFDPRWKNSFMFYMTFTSGSKEHTDWMRESIECLIGIHGHITFGKKGNGVSNLKYAKKESLILLRALYKNENIPSLSRKKLKISEALRIVGESL